MFIFFWCLSPCESRAISVFISLINLICKAYDYLCVDPEAWIDTERSPNWEPRVRHIRLHNEKNSFHSEHSLMIALHTFVSSFLSPSVTDSMRLYKNREIWAWTTAIWMDMNSQHQTRPDWKAFINSRWDDAGKWIYASQTICTRQTAELGGNYWKAHMQLNLALSLFHIAHTLHRLRLVSAIIYLIRSRR